MPLEFAWALVVCAVGLHVKSLFFDGQGKHSSAYWSLKRWLISISALVGLGLGVFYVGLSGWFWLLLPVALIFNPISKIETKDMLIWRVLDLVALVAWGFFVAEVVSV